MQFVKNQFNFLHSGFSLFLPICATFLRKKHMPKTSVLHDSASFEKQLMTHKQKKPFVYFKNELTRVANSSFCISKNRIF